MLLGHFAHNTVLTEKRDKESSCSQRTKSEGDLTTNQKLNYCDTLNKHDNRQLQCQKNDSSSQEDEQQSNMNNGISKRNSSGTDSCAIYEDRRNSNDQQCRINGKSSNNKQYLGSAAKELNNRECSNGLHSDDSFRQRSYSHDSLCKTEVGNRNLHKNNENCRKDQLSNQFFDQSHFANGSATQHLDSDHLGNGQYDDDQLETPSDSDELTDRCYGNCVDCGKNEKSHGSIRSKCDHQSCDEDSWTANTPQIESTSENFDVDSTDPER